MKDITDYTKVCTTKGCSNHPDIYNSRCDLCFAWYRQEKKVKDEAYHNRMWLKFKELDASSIEIDGIDYSDNPDFCDTYISSAQWEDGNNLTDTELDELTDWYISCGWMYDLIHNTLY